MNIFYWCVAFLKFEEKSSVRIGNGFGFDNPAGGYDFFDANKIAAIVIIIAYSIYAIIRFCFNSIGGLYMFKRLIIATILAAAVYHKGGYVGFLLGLEFVFMILRFIIEQPKTRCEKIYIIVEWILFSITYIIMFFVLEVAVTAFICMLVVFFMIVILFSDLVDVYLNSENQYAELLDDNNDKPAGPPESDRQLMESNLQ